jgi:membrane protease YdiL (CAAX protease family)
VNAFRLKPMGRGDWLWMLGSIVCISVCTSVPMFVGKRLGLPIASSPDFMHMEPITLANAWILLAWLPAFFLNIVGEEVFWRGFLFPRQQLVFGAYTWVIQTIGWGIFRLSFGVGLLFTLLPILVATTLAYQKTGNTIVTIVIHGFINGMGFLAVAFGLV